MALRAAANSVLATAIEHKSVLEPLDHLREAGFEVELLPVTAGGYVEPSAVEERLRPDTFLVSVMHASNETGVLQPVLEIAELLGDTKTFYHVDAAQTFGKEVEALRQLRCDFLSIKRPQNLRSQGHGGSLRPARWRPAAVAHTPDVRRRTGDRLAQRCPSLSSSDSVQRLPWQTAIPGAPPRGSGGQGAVTARAGRGRAYDQRRSGHTQAHVVNVSFPGVDSEALMMAVREELAISNGAACTSASYSPSHVLKAMGFSDDRISSAVRISWGPGVDGYSDEIASCSYPNFARLTEVRPRETNLPP